MKQEMMGWQWHQLDCMQIIYTLLQTNNHASTSSLNLLQDGHSSWHPANSITALNAKDTPDEIVKLKPIVTAAVAVAAVL